MPPSSRRRPVQKRFSRLSISFLLRKLLNLGNIYRGAIEDDNAFNAGNQFRCMDKHQRKKELILLVAGLIIVIICIVTTALLVYYSMTNKTDVPEYAIAFFGSISSLMIGYLFGKEKSG